MSYQTEIKAVQKRLSSRQFINGLFSKNLLNNVIYLDNHLKQNIKYEKIYRIM